MDLAELRTKGFFELLDVEMARALGRLASSPDSNVELAVALTSRNVRRGHTCFPLATEATDLWPVEAGPPPNVLPDATRWEAALRESPLTQQGPLVLDGRNRLYFRRYWELEQDIARNLMARSASPSTAADPVWLEDALERLFGGPGASFQRNAARNAIHHRVSLLCGGPGTGKTTAVAAIVALLVERTIRETGRTADVMLLAPTGKSAARLGEAVGRAKATLRSTETVLEAIPEHATTIHRALGMQPSGMRFRHDADRPLEADIVVVDEASMIDLALMRQLLEATRLDATLLIVGDPEQLTSVEAGSVLRDLVNASAQTWWTGRVTHLTKTHRYAEEQPLGRLVAAIRTGDLGGVSALLSLDDADDVAWTPLEGLGAELDRATSHWSETLQAGQPKEHFERRSKFVILSPYRVGPTGTHQLGAAIVARLTAMGRTPRITPIIIEQNSQELQVHNGDFAMLVHTEPRRAVIQRVSEDTYEVAEARLPRYSDAFALSVHKAQGSEFDEVLIVLPEKDAPLLTRELLYTAVSRAKKRVRLVGPKEVIAAAVTRRAQRYSGLVDAIAAASRASA